MTAGWSGAEGVGDALTRGAVVVAALLLAGPALRLLLAGLTRLPGRAGRLAAAAGIALRPGVVRRLLALALGLGLPAVGALPPAGAVVAVDAPALGLAGPAQPRHAQASPVVVTVVVVPGDTLWDIARRHLPVGARAADVARAWPRWYAANRDVIGPDPSMLRPGTRLRSPDLRSAGTPRGMHDRPRTTTGGAAALGAVAQSLDPDRR